MPTARAPSPTRVAVVVFGDLGRSPRMLYHALALAEAGARVELVGYVETDLDPAVEAHPAIRVHRLRPPARDVPRGLFVAHGLARVARQAVELVRVLVRAGADTILVQTPPAVPTLLAALAAARVRRARLVVDWHNFGWAMLALRMSARHPIVRVARAWERLLGPRADAHLCVSQAMADELARAFGIHAVVLRDRPAARFAPVAPARRDAVRARLAADCGVTGPLAVVVAPTGWTVDEDVDLLLEAAARLDAALGGATPTVVVVATGDGPRREAWMRRAAALALRRVRLRAEWLPAAEYPAFLAAADVGVSVHRSASGVDLPMKIADLLGAGVPVCALAYGPCLSETMRDGETGLLFRTGEELAAQLRTLVADSDGLLARLRGNVARTAGPRWADEWRERARPVLVP
jgi:beta-1,4-mannosyltransferase